MHFIREDEEGTNFDELLTPDDLKELNERRAQKQASTLLFSPRYAFRPTPAQVCSYL